MLLVNALSTSIFGLSLCRKKSGGGYDFLVLHGVDSVNANIKKAEILKQETLISVLDTEEALWKRISKTVRNEIRRCEKDNTEVTFVDSHEVSISLLNEIADIHSEMYEQKGITGHKVNLTELQAYANNHSLLVSKAVVGDSLVYHVYVHDEKTTRLIISCSLFRAEDKETRNRIGRANKYLHWRDYLKFLEQGVTEYEWGGISSTTNPNGIDRFKMAFGGEPKSYYNATIPVSLVAKLFASFVKR